MSMFIHYKKYLLTTAVFGLYLLTVPFIIALLIPCLKPTPGEMYDPNACAIDLMFQYFLVFAFIGMALITLFTFWDRRVKSLKSTLMIALLSTAMVIGAFHLYIPYIQKQILKAPMLLYDPARLPKQ